MNREAMRIAAQAKSGKLGVYMFQEPKKKNKKFGYKGRKQQFSVRKDAPENEDPHTQHQQLGKTTTLHGKPPTIKTAPARTSNKTHGGNTANANKQVSSHQSGAGRTSNQKDKSRTDFINKNKQVQEKSKEKTGNRADMVTLTQDQLNAILQTIGGSGSGASAATFAIDDGKLRVTQGNQQRSEPERPTEDVRDQKPGQNGDETLSSALVNGHHGDDPNNNYSVAESQPYDRKAGVVEEQGVTSGSGKKQSPRGGGGPDLASSIGGIGGQDNRSLLEKKRQQWKQELDDQVAEKKAHQATGGRGRSHPSEPADTWSPWGQPGGGAPPSNIHGGVGTSQRQHQALQATGNRGHSNPSESANTWSPWGQPGGGAPPSNIHGQVGTSPRQHQVESSQSRMGRSRGQESADVLSHSMSGVGSHENQQKVPAAMRSSFVFGGPVGTGSQIADVKRKEKEEWIRDLEKQRREAKEKKEQEKAKQRDSGGMQHWAEPVEQPVHRTPRMEPRVAQVQDDFHVKSSIELEKKEPIMEKQPKSAPPPSSRMQPDDDDENRMHIRPANTLVDPAEMERREMQRKKHLEHMAAVKAQVEEKQRLKREAQERKRRDEAEEERRLREERDLLNQDFETEQERVRKKEEAAAAKQRALVESMQNAQKEAQLAKHQQRMSKLQRQGHDVTNLRKSWDVDRHDEPPLPGISPRLPANTNHHHHQPQVATSLNFSPRVAEATTAEVSTHYQASSVPHAHRDAATSPIHEVATQTEIDVLDTEYLSPRLIEAIRLAGAGAEFKPKGKKHRDQERKKQPHQTDSRKEESKGSKTSSRNEDHGDVGRGENRRGSNTEKPKWGQTNANKKKLKNSDKDMSMSKKKREERLRKRQEEMLAMQEKNVPKRMFQPKQSRAESNPPAGEVESKGTRSRAEGEGKGTKSRVEHTRVINHAQDSDNRPIHGVSQGQTSRKDIGHQDKGRASRKEVAHQDLGRSSRRDGAHQHKGHGSRAEELRAAKVDYWASESDQRPTSSEDSSYRTLPESPPLRNGDFIPFMRTEAEELQAGSQSLTPSPAMASEMSDELRHGQQPIAERESVMREELETRYTRQSRQSHREMDPLLNPDRLKDKEHRQEQILQQLSTLRQGLLMKQREMEMGFSPSPPVVM